MSAPEKPRGGMPRWLLWAIGGKLLLIALIVGAIVWYANR